MCGIAGVWWKERKPAGEIERELKAMADTLVHRGPDDHATFVDASIGLAHRRLSIVDLSPEGRQPMASDSGRYHIAYNGEVYNCDELRAELGDDAPGWRGHSDTEVLLACIERWGVAGAIERANGMFAFGLWDRKERVLWLGRDRLGIKPLYVCALRSGIAFASELHALRALPSFDTTLDRGALAAYLQLMCVPAPQSIFRGTRKLEPGTLLELRAADLNAGTVHRYWSARDVALRGQANLVEGGPEEWTELVSATISDAVRRRMVADVPLGAFLSGGIDSSTVVAMMQANSGRPVRTFSIGNETAEYDESGEAERVAAHLGTDHTSLVVSGEHARRLIPEMPRWQDEPFADSSQLPTYLVSRLAREHVTVALSGDGGDEVFGGYNRHQWAPRLWKWLSAIPAPIRRAGAGVAASIPRGLWEELDRRGLGRFVRVPGDKVQKAATVARAKDFRALYAGLRSTWPNARELVLGQPVAPPVPDVPLGSLDPASSLMWADLVSYLPNDILTKVDRASMAVSLEARVPLLDHRVVELGWRLPLEAKLREGTTKWTLRQVLYQHVPKAMVERPKMGFGVPIGRWLRGPLREWAEDLLDERRLREQGILHVPTVRAAWAEHLSERQSREHALWGVLMFQAWLDHRR